MNDGAQHLGWDPGENGRAQITHLARDSVDGGVDAVVACGGDGTVHYVLQALAGSDVALGTIPVGSGNDFAAALNLPADHRMACEVIGSGKTRRIDLARINERWLASVAGTGLSAIVNRLVNHRPVWLGGRAGYLSAALRSLWAFEPKHMEIEFDAQRFAGEVTLVAVGNTMSYGGGCKIVPEAKLDDGWLDLCIVKRVGKPTLLRNLPLLYRGGHVRHPAVAIHRARRVALSSSEPMELFGDGEYIQNLPVSIEVAPAALRVIVR
jgi:diacylglycerol kinase (ATP)